MVNFCVAGGGASCWRYGFVPPIQLILAAKMPLLQLFHRLKDRGYGRTVAGLLTDVAPNDLPCLIHQKHGRAGDPFLRMQNAILANEILEHIRQDRVAQLHFRSDLLTVGGRIRADRNHFSAQALDFLVIVLQLTELRTAEPSSLSPVEDNQDRLLSPVRIQVDRHALDRKPRDLGRHALNLQREKHR